MTNPHWELRQKPIVGTPSAHVVRLYSAGDTRSFGTIVTTLAVNENLRIAEAYHGSFAGNQCALMVPSHIAFSAVSIAAETPIFLVFCVD